MTLRFKEPPHDICIRDASPEQLRAFLNMLGKAFKRKDVPSLMPHLSPLVPVSTAQLQKPLKTLVITSKAQYHALNSFSECLENLKVCKYAFCKCPITIILVVTIPYIFRFKLD